MGPPLTGGGVLTGGERYTWAQGRRVPTMAHMMEGGQWQTRAHMGHGGTPKQPWVGGTIRPLGVRPRRHVSLCHAAHLWRWRNVACARWCVGAAWRGCHCGGDAIRARCLLYRCDRAALPHSAKCNVPCTLQEWSRPNRYQSRGVCAVAHNVHSSGVYPNLLES